MNRYNDVSVLRAIATPQKGDQMPDTVQNQLVVSIAYTLRLTDGEVVDSSEADEPLEYLHGASNIIPGLERALTGMRVGENKQVRVAPADGYGEYDPEEVEEVDRAELPTDLPLQVGMVLEIDDEDGYVSEATVRAVTPRTITLDYNHPLAGKELLFDVEVVGIREATEDELAHGHAHSMGFMDDEDFDDEDGDWDEDDEDGDDLDDPDYLRRIVRQN